MSGQRPKVPEKGATCEEASTLSRATFIPCGRPAIALVKFESGEGPYKMCAMCAAHNVGRRGASYVMEGE